MVSSHADVVLELFTTKRLNTVGFLHHLAEQRLLVRLVQKLTKQL